MANDSSAFFYWYRRYKVRAADMTGFQQAMVEAPRGLGEGLVGTAVLTGLDVSADGSMALAVSTGIGMAASGYLCVQKVENVVTVPAAGVSPSRHLVVLRAAPEDSNYIPSPTDPFTTVPLKQLQKSVVTLVQGAASGTPDYPAKGANDVILCGVMLPAGATGVTSDMLDFEVRETVGTHSQIQKQQNHQDDRLKPFRSGPKVVGIKSSQTSGSGAKLFSYPSKSTPSVFPLSGGVHNDLDTFLDMSTGQITGGDATTPAFTPVIPSGNNSVICAITLSTDDTLSFAFGNEGTLSECLAAIRQQKTSGAGAVPNTGGLYPIAYAVVTSFGGAYSDVHVIDARPAGGGGGGGGAAPIFFDEVLGTGNGSTTIFALPKKPKDAASVLVRLDGLVQDSGYTVNTSAPSITFSTAPEAGQRISAYGVAEGPSPISGYQGVLSGVVNGVNQVFSIGVNPVDKASTLVKLDGVVVDPDEWTLIQSPSTSYVQFSTAPETGQEPSIFCLINVIAAGAPVTPGGGAVVFGSKLSPVVVNPASGIAPSSDLDQTWWIKPSSGAGVPFTSLLQVLPGTTVGQSLELIGVSDTDYFTIVDGSGVDQNGVCNLNSNQAIRYKWDGATWYETTRRA